MNKVLIFFIAVSMGTAMFSQESYIITTGPESNLNFKIASSIVKEAYRRIDMDVEINYTSLLRSLTLSNSGKSDAELIRAFEISENYPNLIIVDEPVLTIDIVGFSYKKDLGIKNIEDLKDYRIAYERGIRGIATLTEGLNTIAVDNLKLAFELLKYNRVDVVITGYYNGLYSISHLDIKDEIYSSDPLQSTPLYHFVNVKHADIVPKLNIALTEFDHKEFIDVVLQE